MGAVNSKELETLAVCSRSYPDATDLKFYAETKLHAKRTYRENR